MAGVVADTDVLIDTLHGREPSASRIQREILAESLLTTAVTSFELLSGARDQKVREQTQGLLGCADVLPLDDVAGQVAAAIRRDLEARGAPIGYDDYLIAAICVSRSLPLLTRNTRHFRGIDGLTLAEW